MTASPDNPNYQDAVLLWKDTKRILSQLVGTDRQLAMMNACEPVSMDGNYLKVRTKSSYAKHNLENAYLEIREALSEAAFQPMEFSIELEESVFEGAKEFPDFITKGFTRDYPKAVGVDEDLDEGELDYGPWSDSESGSGSDPESEAESAYDSIPPIPSLHPSTGISGGDPSNAIPSGLSRTTLSEDEFRRQFSSNASLGAEAGARAVARRKAHRQMPPDDNLGEADSHFTFETFVEGAENQFALYAAKQVANGGHTLQYNPLFIYGDSGLGKTHLLLSIKNYIAANDPSRFCTYKLAREFIDDYAKAMQPDSNKTIRDALQESYREVDVLILDDIQHLRTAQGTIEFFFDTFNYLISHGKQIVLAADVPPAELGMADRITSRMGSGFQVAIELPTLELKRNLIHAFYERDKADDLPGYEGTIPDDVLDTMAQYCGNNIRLIKAYVQQSIFLATQIQRSKPGSLFNVEDAESLAKERGLVGHHVVTVDEIQAMVVREMHVSHAELISNKRNKEIAQARHVAIWLCRQLTDNTYKDIGLRFGGRSHTTCLHSCEWVDTKLRQRTDRALIDTITSLRRKLETL